MDQQGHGQTSATGIVSSAAAVPYGIAGYQPNQMMGTSAPGSAGSIRSPTQPSGASAPSSQLAQHQLAYQHIHRQQQQQLQQQLQRFWIKKIMKADEDVRMISAEAPVVFARACEMFILELTLRSWNHTEENKRRTLQKNDIGAAITRTDIFDFLVDIVPRDDIKDEVLGSVPRIEGPAEGLPYYYMPPQLTPRLVLRE
ncbi:Nuclear transcription factor Y subunit C-9 [Hibiscus syriacus]|uniref:Nuclear transcription factor Y subunit C-9 n=1 Tax=Hibiscus syriacus TaxID=106335 RepID=A0A6A2XPX4_HIBSY|nr:Nuclear transcription factor Y subunit C-9 [Hibiscus syriacus]